MTIWCPSYSGIYLHGARNWPIINMKWRAECLLCRLLLDTSQQNYPCFLCLCEHFGYFHVCIWIMVSCYDVLRTLDSFYTFRRILVSFYACNRILVIFYAFMRSWSVSMSVWESWSVSIPLWESWSVSIPLRESWSVSMHVWECWLISMTVWEFWSVSIPFWECWLILCWSEVENQFWCLWENHD